MSSTICMATAATYKKYSIRVPKHRTVTERLTQRYPSQSIFCRRHCKSTKPDKIWVHKSLNASHTARCNMLPQSPRLPGPHRLGWLFRRGSTINRDWFQPTQIRRKAFWTTHVLALKSVLFTSFKQTLENFSFFSRISWKQRAFQRQKPRGWALAQRRWAENPVHW